MLNPMALQELKRQQAMARVAMPQPQAPAQAQSAQVPQVGSLPQMPQSPAQGSVPGQTPVNMVFSPQGPNSQPSSVPPSTIQAVTPGVPTTATVSAPLRSGFPPPSPTAIQA